MNQKLNQFIGGKFGSVISKAIQDRVKSGSLKAIKKYISLVKTVRFAVMGLSALSMLSAVFVSGIILLVLGLIALIPLAAANFQIVLLSVGALLTILSGTAFFLGFSEKRWLELSKSYEMMDAVLGPWEGLTPPNPFKPSTAVSIDASSEPGQATTAAESASVATNDTNAPATAATIAETAVHSEIEEDLRLLSRDARDAANSPFGANLQPQLSR